MKSSGLDLYSDVLFVFVVASIPYLWVSLDPQRLRRRD